MFHLKQLLCPKYTLCRCCYKHDQCYGDLQNNVCSLLYSVYSITYKYHGCSTCGNYTSIFSYYSLNFPGFTLPSNLKVPLEFVLSLDCKEVFRSCRRVRLYRNFKEGSRYSHVEKYLLMSNCQHGDAPYAVCLSRKVNSILHCSTYHYVGIWAYNPVKEVMMHKFRSIKKRVTLFHSTNFFLFSS